LNLECEFLVSKFAVKFNLCRYTTDVLPRLDLRPDDFWDTAELSWDVLGNAGSSSFQRLDNDIVAPAGDAVMDSSGTISSPLIEMDIQQMIPMSMSGSSFARCW
jgi:hypothetical protein